MISEGETIRAISGARIRVEAPLAAGGQGQIFTARHLEIGEFGMLKIFAPEHTNPSNAKRDEHLVGQRIDKEHAAFVAPHEAIIQKTRLGHFSRTARGIPLDQFLYETEPLPYVQYVQMTLALVGAFHRLHSLGWIHGDIHPGNIFVYWDPDTMVLYVEIIDFDNYRTASLPLPPSIGHPLYLAPELGQAIRNRRPAFPDLASENYALGLVVHEGLLLKHPAIGHYTTPAEFDLVMSNGRWPDDPMLNTTNAIDQGYPPLMLDCQTASLFRRVHGLDPANRPTAHEWLKTISAGMHHINICDVCSAPCFADPSKTTCPACRTLFATPTLVILKSGKRIPLDNGCVRVGRPEFDGELTVSSVHAVFRQFGPETIIQPLGRNGTYRHQNGTWERIRDGQEVQVEKGDRLRFADVEARIE